MAKEEMSKLVKSYIGTNKVVAYFDVMGFEERIFRDAHEKIDAEVMDPLCLSAKTINNIHKIYSDLGSTEGKFVNAKSVVFSDTLLIISDSDSHDDTYAVMRYSEYILSEMLQNGVPIKGAIAHGRFTANFDINKFFGRPLIDAYRLAEQVNFYGVVYHDSFERHLKSIAMLPAMITGEAKVPMKGGKITHKFIKPIRPAALEAIDGFYDTVSGNTRIYVDNTKSVYVEK